MDLRGVSLFFVGLLNYNVKDFFWNAGYERWYLIFIHRR